MEGGRLFVLIIGFVAFSHTAFAEQKWLSDWEFAREESGIKAECRQHKSKINQCRFNLQTDLPVNALAAINVDPDNLYKWMANVVSSERIEPSFDTFNYHVHSKFSFPGARARDAVTRTSAQILPGGGFELHFQTTKNPKALRNTEDKYDEYVRFEAMKGVWRFTPLANGKTDVYYENIGLPGGIVQNTPLYLVYNHGALDASFRTILDMIEAAKAPQYMHFKLEQLDAMQGEGADNPS